LVALALGLAGIARASGSDAVRIAIEEFSIPALDPGITLYVRNKHPRALARVPAEKILLIVHGATWPAEVTFDLKLNGLSWMDYIAQHGYDVYLVDVRGYGRSTRPPEMSVPPEQNEPIVRTVDAVRDVGAAVDFILRRRGVRRLNLLGWSWGTSTAGWYTAQHNDRVVKLVLYAPVWIGDLSRPVAGGSGQLGAWRGITREMARSTWLAGVPEARQADFIPAGWFDSFMAAALASDPVGAAAEPPVMRAPNGVFADNREYWNAGKPLYDPAEIRVPTLLVHGEWDVILPNDMLYGYFAHLVNAPYRRYVQIGEATHHLLMERNRMQAFEAVQQFLDERLQSGQ